MRYLPVHWREGLFLRPHHFQAADRHWSELIQTSQRWDHPYGYGLEAFEFSPEALANGHLEVRTVRARMRDGTLVSLDAGRLVFERYQMDAAGRRGVWSLDTVPTPSLAKLQVPVGRRGNTGCGALIGFAVGLGLGIACASEDSGVGAPSDESCAAGYVVMSTATGALIGLLVKSDVWGPAVLPVQPREPPEALSR